MLWLNDRTDHKAFHFSDPKVLGFALATWHMLYLDQDLKAIGATMVNTVRQKTAESSDNLKETKQPQLRPLRLFSHEIVYLVS